MHGNLLLGRVPGTRSGRGRALGEAPPAPRWPLAGSTIDRSHDFIMIGRCTPAAGKPGRPSREVPDRRNRATGTTKKRIRRSSAWNGPVTAGSDGLDQRTGNSRPDATPGPPAGRDSSRRIPAPDRSDRCGAGSDRPRRTGDCGPRGSHSSLPKPHDRKNLRGSGPDPGSEGQNSSSSGRPDLLDVTREMIIIPLFSTIQPRWTEMRLTRSGSGPSDPDSPFVTTDRPVVERRT